MKTLKYSRQRESIKNCLMNRHDHPTADTIYMSMREEFPAISLGTVYRNLNLLVELGEIQKLSLSEGADRFDADILLITISSVRNANRSQTCRCHLWNRSIRSPRSTALVRLTTM